jgi:hypothetical protein
MISLEQLVEEAEARAALAEAEAARFLERERISRRRRVEEASRAIDQAAARIEANAARIDDHARTELQTEARFELRANSPRARRPPLKGLSLMQGTALCSLVLGFSFFFGGCFSAPIMLLAALVRGDDG